MDDREVRARIARQGETVDRLRAQIADLQAQVGALKQRLEQAETGIVYLRGLLPVVQRDR